MTGTVPCGGVFAATQGVVVSGDGGSPGIAMTATGGARAPRPLEPAVLGDYLDRLYRAAWGLCGSREEAEDLVQETYLRVLARPRMLRDGDDLAYLLRALRNTFVSQRRRGRVKTTALAEDAEPHEARSALIPHDAAEAADLLAVVASLPPHWRDALVAVDLLGLSYQQAARALRLRTGTIKSRLHAARRALLNRLDG